MIPRIFLLAPLLFLLTLPAATQDYNPDLLSTYSIIARDPATGEMGMGVQSKAFAVGNRVVDAKGGLGIIAHQAVSNPMYGVIGLELLQAGMTPQDALEMMVRGDELRDRRQVAVLDSQGRSAAWTGPETRDWTGHKCGADYCAQGNSLAGPQVLEQMWRSFDSSVGPLAERLLGALDAAQAAGGDARGMQGAAILVVKPLAGAGGFSDRAIDIRVDDHKQPLAELRRLLDIARSREMMAQAGVKLNEGDLDGALERAIAARDRSPDYDSTWVVLADVHISMGRKSDALSAFRRAVELNPANKIMLPRTPRFEALLRDADFMN